MKTILAAFACGLALANLIWFQYTYWHDRKHKRKTRTIYVDNIAIEIDEEQYHKLDGYLKDVINKGTTA